MYRVVSCAFHHSVHSDSQSGPRMHDMEMNFLQQPVTPPLLLVLKVHSLPLLLLPPLQLKLGPPPTQMHSLLQLK